MQHIAQVVEVRISKCSINLAAVVLKVLKVPYIHYKLIRFAFEYLSVYEVRSPYNACSVAPRNPRRDKGRYFYVPLVRVSVGYLYRVVFYKLRRFVFAR